MPLIRKWKINENAVAAIWEIAEPLEFFEEVTGLSPAINNIKRKTEHLAGRFLLQYLVPGFPISEIVKDNQDKPRVPGLACEFSISHSYPYVAVVADNKKSAGIDIQVIRAGIVEVKHKFLSSAEQRIFDNDIQLLTLAWSAKEAIYKWHGKRGLEFIEGIPITYFEKTNPNHINANVYFNESKYIIINENVLNVDYVCSVVKSVGFV